jgi:hypothetical protein
MIKIKPSEMGSTHGRIRTTDKTFIHKPEGIILKWALKEKSTRVWTGSSG